MCNYSYEVVWEQHYFVSCVFENLRGLREEIQLFSYLHLASAIVHLECRFGIKKPQALNLDRGENCNGKNIGMKDQHILSLFHL